MGRFNGVLAGTGCLALASCAFAGGWVNYNDETSMRMPIPLNEPGISTSDPEEKDYAWGDFDHDGDTDLAVARKQPFTSVGGKRNVLFMNEGIADGHAMNGVLADRSAQYIPGFLDATNDRDIVAVDVDNDGWLDLVTAPAYGSAIDSPSRHPRVYMNLGESGGEWQGFELQESRIPNWSTFVNFCGVESGDVTNDGHPDLFFIDYDSFVAPSNGFDDRLLINDGNGFFLDESEARMTPGMLSSGFGISIVIADMNDDGWADITQNEAGSVRINYNDGTGNFDVDVSAYSGAAYFVSGGDLNGDGRMDLIVGDDGTDQYVINNGPGSPGGTSSFTSFNLSGTGGFNGNNLAVDLNNDKLLDIITTDNDVDVGGCGRTSHIFRNLGNPGTNPGYSEQGSVIPTSLMHGIHDTAVFDINGDGWMDIVMGHCNATRIWINEPPAGLIFSYPGGFPAMVDPGSAHDFQVQLSTIGDGSPTPGSLQMFVSVDDGPFAEVPVTSLGGDLYDVSLPATDCPDRVNFYFEADMDGAGSFAEPADAPATYFTAVAAEGTATTFEDEIEGDISDWQIVNDPSLTAGGWEQADPVGTIWVGDLAAPDQDGTQAEQAILAFVTQNGAIGGPATAADVDGGPTYLISPAIDLADTDATITFTRWFFSATGTPDQMTVDVSNDGGKSWTPVEALTTSGTGSQWEPAGFVVSEYIEPTDQVMVRFGTSDSPSDSVTEAGIDNFHVEEFVCEAAPCDQDLDGSGAVGFADLLQLLAAWGECAGCPADFNGDGNVNFSDLLTLLNAWGDC